MKKEEIFESLEVAQKEAIKRRLLNGRSVESLKDPRECYFFARDVKQYKYKRLPQALMKYVKAGVLTKVTEGRGTAAAFAFQVSFLPDRFSGQRREKRSLKRSKRLF